MLRSVKEIHNYVLQAEDGEIGRCKDLLFDDRFWTIRYMVADTGKWLPGRKVLLSPISLGEPDWSSRVFPIRLTKKRIEEAPGLDKDAPVSRQHEILWTQYYGWPYYWGGGPYAWGAVTYPGVLYDQILPENKTTEVDSGDDHLRSVHEVTGYHIQATDDEVGHVEDFIVDDETWIIRYMVVDTRNWLPGKKVLVPPTWIDSVDWTDNKVSVALTREQVKDSPEYDPSTVVNREYEVRLYDFYGRPKYW
ncbi:PRC-barrel domain-containing protein [Candidatus Electrothrix sp.]|uniref:PRC-barrel domain-containing protein n=1 Tax=Candidatus Electrothrix sp. TaxID=2170559 RepID=UPI00405649DA